MKRSQQDKQVMNTIKIFDLDGTVINSYHRVKKALSTGTFCLDTYLKECNSPKQIANDTLLPLASYMQSLAKSGEQYAIITARFNSSADIAFLINNGLINRDTILLGRESVTADIRALPDTLYKVHQLNVLKSLTGHNKRYVMFEDMPNIISALAVEGVTMFNAIELNNHLDGLATPQHAKHNKRGSDNAEFIRFYQQCLAVEA